MGAFTKLDGSSWTAAVVGALVTGVPVGIVAGWWSARWRQRMKDAEGGLPPDKVRLAHRAAMGGDVPEDEEIRSAALRIASGYLADYTSRARRLSIIVMAALLIGSIAAAVSESLWALWGALVPALLLYMHWYWPRRLRRRIQALGPGPTETTR
ncbi:hypothetical protein [Kribbella sp. HUAS MG21]|jgi:hypothetical protein|uniref:Tight adherence protein B n=1 Tax=Kribbella sp. HUAS MG21 TaxID=3160966 RepID=A0AAU7TKS0_9ACTN